MAPTTVYGLAFTTSYPFVHILWGGAVANRTAGPVEVVGLYVEPLKASIGRTTTSQHAPALEPMH